MITKKTENDGSIENRLFLDGKTKFLLCTETPMKKKFQDRVKLNKKIMEEVIKISKL